MPDAEALIAELMDTLKPSLYAVIRKAVEGGVSIGRDEALEEATKRMSLLGQKVTELVEASSRLSERVRTNTERRTASIGQRASQGTVKPTLLALISRSDGATVREMEATGVKHNSIRGTVYALQKEGKIEKHGDRWYSKITEASKSEDKEAPF